MSDAKNARSKYTVFQLNNLNSDSVEFTSVSTAFFLCFIQLISLNSAFLYFYIEKHNTFAAIFFASIEQFKLGFSLINFALPKAQYAG